MFLLDDNENLANGTASKSPYTRTAFPFGKLQLNNSFSSDAALSSSSTNSATTSIFPRLLPNAEEQQDKSSELFVNIDYMSMFSDALSQEAVSPSPESTPSSEPPRPSVSQSSPDTQQPQSLSSRPPLAAEENHANISSARDSVLSVSIPKISFRDPGSLFKL